MAGDIFPEWAGTDPTPPDIREAIRASGMDDDYVLNEDGDVDLGADPNAAPVNEVTEESLNSDPTWIEASKRLKRVMQGTVYASDIENPSDIETAEWGKEFMGWFNYNMPSMAWSVNKMDQLDDGDKLAMLYMMEKYDQKNISWAGTQRFFKGMLYDPTTYVGLGTFGIGTFAGASVKQLTKVGLKSALKNAIPAMKLGALEGALFAGGEDLLTQSVKVKAGRQKELDLVQTGISAATGTVAGTGIVGLGAGGGRLLTDVAKAAARRLPRRLHGAGDTNINERIVRETRKKANQIAETFHIKGPEREAIRRKITDDLDLPAMEQEKQLYLVIGPPASGKSMVADPLAEKTGSILVDSDDAKKVLPEFQNGIGGPATHEESDIIANTVFSRAVQRGDNIVQPLVGKSQEKIDNLIDGMTKMGYDVHLLNVDLPIEKAAVRAVERLKGETKRWVDPLYVLSVKDKPNKTYEALKEKAKSYAKYSNDVPYGEDPILIERSK